MARHRYLLAGGALLALGSARPLSAQRILDWQNQWYWGVKGGVLGYSLPSFGSVRSGQIGGEWLITARRVGLYLGYSRSLTAETDSFPVPGLTRKESVSFDAMQRIQIAAVALVGDRAFQPYVGLGFVIETLSNARDNDPTASPTVVSAVDAAASGGFLQVMGGVQLRFARKGALFGHFQFSPQGKAFLLAGSSSSFEVGLRWAFLPSKENDPTRR